MAVTYWSLVCAILSLPNNIPSALRNLKRFAVVALSISALILFGMASYHFISPKVVIKNGSSAVVHEAIVYLPTSQLTFDPVDPGEQLTIYYSPQKQSGELKYSMRVNGSLQTGALLYGGFPDYGRVIHFEVDALGKVTVSVAN